VPELATRSAAGIHGEEKCEEERLKAMQNGA